MPWLARIFSLLFVFFSICLPVFGQTARQSTQGIYQAVELFLRKHAKTLPGEVKYEIGAIDPRLSLAACGRPIAELAHNVKPWGPTRVSVNCNDYAVWTIFVPVTIRVYGMYPVAARPLQRGETLTEADIALQKGDLSMLPQQVELDMNNLLGKELSVGLSNGQPFRRNMVKQPTLVMRGQNVTIIYASASFSVTNTGQALSNGGVGSVIGVRTSSGTVIKGVVQEDGSIRVQ